MESYELAERSIVKKYRRQLWLPFLSAVKKYRLIQEGDRIAVCISGGKDSCLMAKCMQHLQKYSDFPFEVEYLVMDPGYNSENRQRIIDNATALHLPIKIFDTRVFEIAEQSGRTPCYLCAKCDAAASTNMLRNLAAIKSRSVTTLTMSLKPF